MALSLHSSFDDFFAGDCEPFVSVEITDGTDTWRFISDLRARKLDSNFGAAEPSIQGMTALSARVDPLTGKATGGELEFSISDASFLRDTATANRLKGRKATVRFGALGMTRANCPKLMDGAIVVDVVPSEAGFLLTIGDAARRTRDKTVTLASWDEHPISLMLRVLLQVHDSSELDLTTFAPSAYDTSISHLNLRLSYDRSGTLAITTPRSAREIVQHLAQLCGGSILYDEDGTIRFKRYSAPSSADAVWGSDTISGFRQLEGYGRVINRIVGQCAVRGDQNKLWPYARIEESWLGRLRKTNESMPEYRVRLVLDDTTSQTNWEHPDQASEGYVHEFPTFAVNAVGVLASTIEQSDGASDTFNIVGVEGFSGLRGYNGSTYAAESELSGARPAYLLIGSEIIEIDDLAAISGSYGYPASGDYGSLDLDAQPLGATPPHSATATIASRGHWGTTAVEHSIFDGPIEVYDVTAMVLYMEAVKGRYNNGVPIVQVETSLAQYALQLRDIVEIESDVFASYGYDGVADADDLYWEIVGKDPDVFGGRIVWTLAKAAAGTTPAYSAVAIDSDYHSPLDGDFGDDGTTPHVPDGLEVSEATDRTPVVVHEASSLENFQRLALDVSSGHIYYTTGNDGGIRRCDLNGENDTAIIAKGTYDHVRGIGLDLVNSYIYFSIQGTAPSSDIILRCTLAGASVTTIYTYASASADPNDPMPFTESATDYVVHADDGEADVDRIAVGTGTKVSLATSVGRNHAAIWDDTNALIHYAVASGSDSLIRTMTVAGASKTTRETVTVGAGNADIEGLRFDETDSRYIFTETAEGKIRRANYDGTGAVELANPSHTPFALDVDWTNGWIYYTVQGGDLYRIPLIAVSVSAGWYGGRPLGSFRFRGGTAKLEPTRDNYVYIDTSSGLLVVKDVANGASPPQFDLQLLPLAKCVTDASSVTGTTDLRPRHPVGGGGLASEAGSSRGINPNSDFETARRIGTRPPDGYRLAAGTWGSDVLEDLDDSHRLGGARAIKFASGATASHEIQSRLLPVEEGEWYGVEADVEDGGSSMEVAIYVRWYDDDLSTIGSPDKITSDASGNLVQIRERVDAPTNARYARVCAAKNAGTSYEAWVSALRLTRIVHPGGKARTQSSLYQTSDTTHAPGWTKCTYDATEVDNSGGRVASSRWTAKNAVEEVTVEACARLKSLTAGNTVLLSVYVNGSMYRLIGAANATSGNTQPTVSGSCTVVLTSGQYAEVYIYNPEAGNKDTNGQVHITWAKFRQVA